MCRHIAKWISERRSEDIYGNSLKFCTVLYGHSAHSREYVFTKEAFSFRRWLLFMMLFSSLAFYCEFYNTDVSFLGMFLCLLCSLLLLKLHLKVKQESLLVIASLGLQLTTTFVTGRKASRFILRRHVQDVVINEGIFMHRVLFYLVVLLQDMKEPLHVVPLFRDTLPRLDCLQPIYAGLQETFLPQTCP